MTITEPTQKQCNTVAVHLSRIRDQAQRDYATAFWLWLLDTCSSAEPPDCTGLPTGVAEALENDLIDVMDATR